MKSKQIKIALLAGCIASAMASNLAQASHFRGAAIVPQVDSTGMLTIDAKTFWRFNSTLSNRVDLLNISGPGLNTVINNDSRTTDTSDVRRLESNQVFSTQLPGAGLYTLSWGSGSWVSGVPNADGSYGTTSTIFWDGQSANAPIIFDLENIQQEVVRGVAYSDNLDAVGNGLTYDDTHLSIGMFSQANGYSIDASGQINMSSATTSGILDNASNIGADRAFSGEINAADGSSIEFVWLFDAVSTASNNAPSITDLVINALVGDVIDETLVVTDPDGDPITVSFNSIFGPGGIIPGNSTFDPSTWNFMWDTTGFGVGSYVATFNASDGSLTDQGTIRINLTTGGNPPPPPPPNPAPAPASALLLGIGLLGLVGLRRKKRQ
ncbi:PEP-CTERM sorting domain-containing protein [Paraglaciecola hydrolytica]|uniref:PEP-CTERM protein-sorting domain-containing protein n=1 Tax=Paraglaciecola hydrolytica TaxID=1799789 RepID=A0A136A6Z9_9ALTE|nr:PEP-CTERM sorting domain-containing protein [Paraglaciecola hydrolytica]KXI30996.1 hypothetical protein AX660_00610 [Paraglaciecola hydrolytica]